jgi:predicted DNA-binding transcriptional regulator AlpA
LNYEKDLQMEAKHLRAKEMAKYLNIGLSTVWLYAKQGKLTPKKLSDRVTLFSVEEADRLINFDGVVL